MVTLDFCCLVISLMTENFLKETKHTHTHTILVKVRTTDIEAFSKKLRFLECYSLSVISTIGNLLAELLTSTFLWV